jgi:hypothetical protein
MSEVYIRTQNREKLYRLGGNYACIEYMEYEDVKSKRGGNEDNKSHTLCISDGCLEEIGKYESKERCIEILDEIEKLCGQYLYSEGSMGFIRGTTATPPMVAVTPRIYQMPEK